MLEEDNSINDYRIILVLRIYSRSITSNFSDKSVCKRSIIFSISLFCNVFSSDWKTSIPTDLNNTLHPYRSADVYLINGERLGVFGQINPILAKRFNMSSEHYLFEFDLEKIQDKIKTNQITIYKPYSLYPKITKDLSFIIHQDITFKDLKKLIYANGTQFLSEINLLDEYKGSTIPSDYVSLCLQLVFQSNEKTLQNKEIENIIDSLQKLLSEKFDVILRE